MEFNQLFSDAVNFKSLHVASAEAIEDRALLCNDRFINLNSLTTHIRKIFFELRIDGFHFSFSTRLCEKRIFEKLAENVQTLSKLSI